MQAKLLRSLVLLLLLNGLIKPIWLLFIDRRVQALAGAEDYGLYFALFSLSLQLSMLLDPGLHTWNARGLGAQTHSARTSFNSLLRLKLSLGGVYALLTLALGMVLGYGGEAMGWLMGLVALQWLSSMVLWLRSYLSGMQLFGADSLASVADRTLIILLALPFLYGGFSEYVSIPFFIGLQMVALALSALALAGFIRRKTSGEVEDVSPPPWQRILRHSAPIALLTLLMTAYTRLDAVFIERLSGPAEAGVYAAAYRLFDAANIAAYLIGSTLVAAFSRASLDKDAHRTLLRSAAGLMAAIAVPLMTVGIIASDPLMRLLYDGPTAYRWETLLLLMAAYPGVGIMYLFGSALTADGKFRFLNIASLAVLILNVALLLILLPGDEDFRGATIGAFVTFITQWTVGIVYIVYVWKRWGGRWLAWLIAKALILAGAIVALQLALESAGMHWGAVALLALGAGLTFAFLLRMVRIEPFLKALRPSRP